MVVARNREMDARRIDVSEGVKHHGRHAQDVRVPTGDEAARGPHRYPARHES
jgi:hypothetical protein